MLSNKINTPRLVLLYNVRNSKGFFGKSRHKHDLVLWDSRDFWAIAKNSVPELGLVALCLLNVNPTEASVERSFAIQKYIHTKTRNRLLQTNIQQEMFIRFNHSKTKDLKLPENSDFYNDPEDIINEFDDKKIQDELILSDSDQDESFISEKKMTN